MNARAVTIAAATVVLAGLAFWGFSSADVSAPAAVEAIQAPRESTTSPQPSIASPSRGAGETSEKARLYQPRLRTDRVSVVGAEAQGRVQGITPEEAAKFQAVQRPLSPIAIRAGEEEKEARREESRRRKELRKRGIDPGPRDRSDSGPGQRVGEVQDVLDEQADQAESEEVKP